ncbi:phage tail protein [Haloarcula amylolytica]|uniref:phage tail protein n=1 Tax=Haloarcula amylolytica TaxID=396317 RepID=UPI003C765BFC
MVFDELEVGAEISSKGFTSGIDRMEAASSGLKNAMATLSASTSSAASGLSDVGDEAVQSAGEAMTAGSSLDNLGEELTDTATGAALAANRLDAVGDEMTEAGAKAATASAGVTGLRASMFGLSGSLTTVLPAATGLAGAFAAIGTASAPVVTGLAGVAGGFASVAGVLGGGLLAGAVTHMEELKTAVKTAKTEVKTAIKPIGELFGPVLLQGVEALPTLAKRIVATTGDLRPFRDALQEIGQTAMTAIPEATAAFVDFGRQTLPIFTGVTKAILNGLAPAIRFLSGELSDLRSGFADVSGPLEQFWKRTDDLRAAVAPVVDQIQRFGKLAVIAGAKVGGRLLPVFTPLVKGLGNVLTAVNDTIAALLGVGDATDKTATKIRAFAGTLKTAFQTAVENAAATARGFKQQADKAFGSLQPVVSDALGKVQTTVGRITGKMETTWDKHGGKVKDAVRDAFDFAKSHPKKTLTTLATVIVPGPLGTIVQAFKDNWNEVKRTVRTALNSIEDIARTTMQSFKTQILTPARNTESEFRTNINQMLTEGRQTFNTIRDIVGRVMSTFLTNVRENLRSVKRIWKANLSGSDGILANARTAFNSLWNNIIKPTLDLIQSGWDLFGDDLIRIFDGVIGTIQVIAQTGMDALLTGINVVLDLISGDWEGAWNNIKDFFQRTWNRIVDWAKEDGKKLLSGALGVIIDAAKGVFNSFWDWLIGNSFFPDLINAVADWLESTGESLVSGAFDAIVGGIESALGNIDLSSIQDAIQNIIDKASEAIDTVKSIPNNVTTTITRTINETVNGPDDDDDDDGSSGGGSNPGAGRTDSGGGTSGTSGSGGGGSNNAFAGYTDDADTGGDSSGSDLYGGDDAPGLAQGGIVTGPTNALIGEGGEDEFVAPRSTMLRELRDVAEKAMSGGGGGDSIVIEEINVDADSDMSEQDLIRAIKQDLTRELKRLETR